MRSFFLKTFSILLAVLFVSNFLFIQDSSAKSKALKPSPKKIKISVDQVPDGQQSLVVPITFDKTILEITQASSDLSGALVVFSQDGVGVIQTNGNIASMFNLTVSVKGLKRGKTDISTGAVVDKLGGTAISGAIAQTKTKKIKVK